VDIKRRVEWLWHEIKQGLLKKILKVSQLLEDVQVLKDV
jgi:hypothetical protein